MARVYQNVLTRNNWAPASYTANSTPAIWNVAAGDLIRGAFVQIRVAFDGITPVATLGDGGDADGFLTSALVGITATGLKPAQNTSAYLLETQGYLYTSADTIDVTWTQGGTGTAGFADWWVFVSKVNPH